MLDCTLKACHLVTGLSRSRGVTDSTAFAAGLLTFSTSSSLLFFEGFVSNNMHLIRNGRYVQNLCGVCVNAFRHRHGVRSGLPTHAWAKGRGARRPLSPREQGREWHEILVATTPKQPASLSCWLLVRGSGYLVGLGC